jgi:hypothetical protein
MKGIHQATTPHQLQLFMNQLATDIADRIKREQTGKGPRGGTAVEMQRCMQALAAHMMTLIGPQLEPRRLKVHGRPLHATAPIAAAETSEGDDIARLQAELAFEGARRTNESSKTEFEKVMAGVEPHGEAFQEALRMLQASNPEWRQAGWATYNTVRLAYQIQVAPLLAQTDPKITVALLKTQLAQLLYDAERRKRRQTFVGADFPADIRAMYDGFTSWVYEHEKEICVEDQPHKLRSLLMQILKQTKEQCEVLISKWRLLEVVEAEIEREGDRSKLREIKQILNGHYDDQSAVQVEWFFMCPQLREELQKAGYWRDAAVMQVCLFGCRSTNSHIGPCPPKATSAHARQQPHRPMPANSRIGPCPPTATSAHARQQPHRPMPANSHIGPCPPTAASAHVAWPRP